MSKYRRTWLGRLGQIVTLLSLLLFLLNLPYYSGWGNGRFRWRMEHGRIKLELRESAVNPESFYIASNTEGLRFAPQWSYGSAGAWMLNLPLWVPLGAGLILARLGRRRREGA